MNKLMIPCGYRVLVKVDAVTLTGTLRPGEYVKNGTVYSESGFALEKIKVEQELKGATTGTVVSLGHTAYKEFNAPWCQAGDKVFFKRYEGCNVSGTIFGEEDTEYMLINDTDIWAVVSEEK